MASQMSMAYQFPPIDLVPPQANGGAITSANYVSMKNALKAWLVVKVNQGNAATVTITPQQATSLAGAGAKPLGNSGVGSTLYYGVNDYPPIWLNDVTATNDLLTAQTPATSFTTDATLAAKIVLFEIIPEAALDIPNGFGHLGVAFGASNASNIVTATLHIYGGYEGASYPTTLV